MENHTNEKHKIVECSHCAEKIYLNDYPKHKESCKGKDKVCPYCEMQLNPSFFDEHYEMCGSRTEPCPACGINITVHEGMSKHLEECKGRVNQNKPQPTQPKYQHKTTDDDIAEALKLSMQMESMKINNQVNPDDDLTEEELEMKRILSLSKKDY